MHPRHHSSSTLIELVNADPKVRQHSDVKLMIAYISVMSWPRRRAWLSTSLARAKSGLSEAQVITSRKRLVESGYLKPDGSECGTRAFIVENQRPVDIRQHVLLTAEFYRDKQAERQAARRAHVQAVSPENGETEKAMSQHSMENCDVSPNPGGKYP